MYIKRISIGEYLEQHPQPGLSYFLIACGGADRTEFGVEIAEVQQTHDGDILAISADRLAYWVRDEMVLVLRADEIVELDETDRPMQDASRETLEDTWLRMVGDKGFDLDL